MRLIDADRLIDEFEDTIGSPIARTRLKLQVQNQPTIDAVDVVRCEDCEHKYRKEYADGMVELLCQKTYNFNGFAADVEPNHFCSYGERKTDG